MIIDHGRGRNRGEDLIIKIDNDDDDGTGKVVATVFFIILLIKSIIP